MYTDVAEIRNVATKSPLANFEWIEIEIKIDRKTNSSNWVLGKHIRNLTIMFPFRHSLDLRYRDSEQRLHMSTISVGDK